MNVNHGWAVITRRPVVPLAVALVALVVSLALVDCEERDHWYAVWEEGQHWDGAGLAVAKDEAINFFDLDYRRIEDDIDQVLGLATGEFAADYAQQRQRLAAAVRQKHAVWTATIPENGTAVEYAGDDVASVLLAIDVARSTDGVAGPPERERVRLVLTYTNGTWLVSEFQEVG